MENGQSDVERAGAGTDFATVCRRPLCLSGRVWRFAVVQSQSTEVRTGRHGIVEETESEVQTGVFLKGQQPYIDGNPQTKELFFREGIAFNSFLNELGAEPKDVIKSVNGTDYNIENVYGLIMGSRGWKEGDQVTMIIKRDGEEKILEATYKTPTDKETKLQEMELSSDDQRVKLRKAWLEN